jgi:prevent-host-death family protein
MAVTTVSSRQFNQDASGAKKAATKGPVFITHRGHPAHVLLSIEEYRKLTSNTGSIVDLLAMPKSSGKGCKIDFDPPRLKGPIYRPADLD